MTTKVKCFRQAHLDQLHANLLNLLAKYNNDESWVEEFFGAAPWSSETSLLFPANFELLNPDNNSHHDLENTIRLHTALRHLNIAQATDERLWAWLTHVQFWDYMRKRWPIESYQKEFAKPTDIGVNIRDRYFFTGNRDRALVHNGIARLWWYGHVSYDATRSNPYELTAVLLQKLDIAQSLLERSFSRNPAVTKAVLRVVVDQRAEGRDLSQRENFRTLMKHLNRLGGIAVLDLLTEEDIKAELESKVREIMAAST
ncbi:DUF6339 family protein [Herbaspirillum sp. RV1423]|uniref:DUF6339 family protein n=1 Tax=Herbaspirillum sp. RV1423 TaxID=1443993 RepID=UPI000557E3C2|nr:DUF6339 family protein [Herbaspirillum sp. RV1423]